MCHTWGPIGERVPLLCHPGRKSIGVFGAVRIDRNDPKIHFQFTSEHFNTDTFIGFLEQLIQYYQGQKVHLILDRAPYHKSAQRWAELHRDAIEIHLLPAASPELNPTETLWRITKLAATHNRYFPTLESLRTTIRRKFNRFQGNPASLRGIEESWC